jgi:hypothetical protein
MTGFPAASFVVTAPFPGRTTPGGKSKPKVVGSNDLGAWPKAIWPKNSRKTGQIARNATRGRENEAECGIMRKARKTARKSGESLAGNRPKFMLAGLKGEGKFCAFVGWLFRPSIGTAGCFLSYE